MEIFEYQLDCNLFLQAEYKIDGGEPGTYDTPPSYATITINRIFLVSGANRIDITEADPYILDVELDRLEEMIENQVNQ